MISNSVLISNATIGYRVYGSANKTFKLELLRRQNSDNYKEIFSNVSLRITQGESVGIIGKNGAGKSTLVKAIGGAIKPIAGKVQTWGKLNSLIELGIGLNMDLTAKENILLHSELYELPNKGRVFRVLKWAGLEAMEDVPLRTFSSGMLARFNFAVSTDFQPDLLLLDEILSVGDKDFQEKSFHRTQELLASGATIILVSHDLDSIKRFCKRTIYLESGKIIADGPSNKVCEMYAKPE